MTSRPRSLRTVPSSPGSYHPTREQPGRTPVVDLQRRYEGLGVARLGGKRLKTCAECGCETTATRNGLCHGFFCKARKQEAERV